MPVTVNALHTDPALPPGGGAALHQDDRFTAGSESAPGRVRHSAGGGLP
jgi:hypothetical protein